MSKSEENGSPPLGKIGADESKSPSTASSDRWNYAWLVFLYIGQGVIKGMLSHAVPLIVKENGATYGEVAFLTWSSLPSQLKVLFSPLVECIYYSKIGKRKSWLIPCQYLMGIIGVLSSLKIETWIGEKGKESSVSVIPLFILFISSDVLLTLMDMVTDSWALTMLQKENVGYQASCNMIGNRIGNLFGNIILILLRSEVISGYLGQEAPILSLSGYLFFWSVILLINNTVVFVFKKDNSLEVMKESEDEPLTIVKSYKLIWYILKMKSVRRLSAALLTCTFGVELFHGLIHQKLIDGGMTSENIVLFGLPLIPLQAALPFFWRKHFEGSEGMERFARTLIYMIPIGIMYSTLIFFMPFMKDSNSHELTPIFYAMYIVVHGLEYMVFFLMVTAYLSFMAKICDPTCGAVYLTTIQTIGMLGHTWPGYLSTALLGPFTVLKDNCHEAEKYKCIRVDGFHIFVLIGSLYNIFYLYCGGRKNMMRVQNFNANAWQMSGKDVFKMKAIN